LKAVIGSPCLDDAGQQREGAVFEFHHHALERAWAFSSGMLEQLQDHGLILAQHVAGGNAEQTAA
jgi:hypothetical protein